MTTPSTPATDQSGPTRAARDGGPLWPIRRYYGVLYRPQTYLNVLYLLLGLPLGIAYFVTLVTFISVSLGLAITLVGIPLLIATMYYWCIAARFERVQCNVLLGTRITPLQFGPREGGLWSRRGLKARITSSLTWRSLAWLLLRFPQGIATFVIATVIVSVPLWMITLPITARLGGGADLYFWRIDTVSKGAIFVLPGLLLFPAAFWICNVAARVSGRLTVLFLDSPAGSGESPAADHALAAAFTWRGLSLTRFASPEAAQEQTVQLRVFTVHAVVFAGVSLGLLLLNGLTTPGTWWAIWPIWGFAIAFGMHAGYLARGLFGLHVGLFVVVNVGLFIIDGTYSGSPWFVYPLFGWGVLLLIHGYGGRWLMRAQGQPAPLNATLSQPDLAPVAALALAMDEPEEPLDDSHAAPATAKNPAITIDVVMRVVTVAGREVELTPKEFDLLALFAQNPGRPFSRDELLDRIWRNDYEVTDRTIDTHVQRLRKKLGEQSEAIQTVWGVGYKFQTR